MKKIYMTMVAMLCSAAAMAQMTFSAAENVKAEAGQTAYLEIKFAEDAPRVITAAACWVTLPEGFTIAQVWNEDDEKYVADVTYPAAKGGHDKRMIKVAEDAAGNNNTYQFSAASNEDTFKAATDVMFKIGIAVPEGTAKGKYPVKVSFHGYGHTYPNKGHVVKPIVGSDDTIYFNFSPHGYELGREPEYYDEFFRSICSGGRTFGFDEKQNADPENSYFSGYTYRIMRALEWLKTLPEWDGKNLIVRGGSMGGMQSIWAAGLDKDVSLALPSIPWNCDIGGRDTLKRLINSWYIHETPALRYYDPVNLAKRVSKKCRVEITRAGLGDYCCPPSGVAILYNNIPGPKKINWVQGSTHGYIPPEKHQAFSLTDNGWTEK
jgi:cephalosporin-C deacetylase-like acetyl esterase